MTQRQTARRFDLSGSEKRRYQRFPIDLTASIAFGDGQQAFSAVIADFCVAGMMLTFHVDE